MARWNFEDIMDKLMPLLEKKLAFNMEMASRTMSLEEKKEANKTDFEYKKLEAQITGDKDKLRWEKEKLTTTIKGNYDLEQVKNSGMLDVKRLEGLNAGDKQKIVEEGLNRRADQTEGGLNRRADQTDRTAEANKYLNTLGVVLGHAVERTGFDKDGNPYSVKPTAEVGNVARSLMERSGLTGPAATAQAQEKDLQDAKLGLVARAENANMFLQGYKKAGNTADATKFLQSLPPDVQAEALKLYQQGNAAAPAAALPGAPVAPAAAAPGQPAVQPVATPLEPVRPPVQPTAPAAEPVRPPVQPSGFFQKTGAVAQGFMNPENEPSLAQQVAAGPRSDLRTAMDQGMVGTAKVAKQAAVLTGKSLAVLPAETVGAVVGAGREFMVGYDAEAERKKREALHRVRGLNVKGF